jgi:hypothetical protein
MTAGETPTFVELMEAIIELHVDRNDPREVFYWSDTYDGRGPRSLPDLWKTLEARAPNGSVREVVAVWDIEEIRAVYRSLLWGPPNGRPVT